MPIRLDQLDQQGAPATPTVPFQTPLPPVGVPPTAEFQGMTVRTPQGTMKFGPTKPATISPEERAAIKRRNDVQTQMANLQRARAKVDQLFSEAESKLPPIDATGLPLRLAQGGRAVSNLLGNRERNLGFQDTFFVEARKQLKELEKGGRFTDQDIEQMLQAITPQDLESADRRSAKKQQLLKSFQDEYDLYRQELEQMGGTVTSPTSSAPSGTTRSGLRYTVEE